nr:C4-type zinc ribbon domain-containing protein [bacterium]
TAAVADELAALKKQRDALVPSIEPRAMERYLQIRQHRLPPLARLTGDQCSGCSMQLPAAAVRDVKSGEKWVECENCGRILSN